MTGYYYVTHTHTYTHHAHGSRLGSDRIARQKGYWILHACRGRPPGDICCRLCVWGCRRRLSRGLFSRQPPICRRWHLRITHVRHGTHTVLKLFTRTCHEPFQGHCIPGVTGVVSGVRCCWLASHHASGAPGGKHARQRHAPPKTHASDHDHHGYPSTQHYTSTEHASITYANGLKALCARNVASWFTVKVAGPSVDPALWSSRHRCKD